MIIFDLDGTLADCRHRKHYVDMKYATCPTCKIGYSNHLDTRPEPCIDCGNLSRNRGFKPNWKEFYNQCEKDGLIYPVFDILCEFILSDSDVEIWSGRCESVRDKTIRWLKAIAKENSLICPEEFASIPLKMRPENDYTPDDQLKSDWLTEAVRQNRTPEFVFDDRPKVVRMWRRRGIFVFNCNQNDEEF